MRISIIAALAANRVIGRDNQLPWRIPGDLPRFRKLTLGQTLIMGRKTFESIGRPLPGRTTIVLTRDLLFAPAGVEVVHALDDALKHVRTDEAFIAGGGEVYAQALPRAERMLLTRIDHDFEGDALFPTFDESAWNLVADEPQPPTPEFPHAYHYLTYQRR